MIKSSTCLLTLLFTLLTACANAPELDESATVVALQPSTQTATTTPAPTRHDSLTLIEAATSETRNLGIGTTSPRWDNDELLLFNAYDGLQRQTHLYDMTGGERVNWAVVEEEGVSAEIPLQDITFTAQTCGSKPPSIGHPATGLTVAIST